MEYHRPLCAALVVIAGLSAFRPRDAAVADTAAVASRDARRRRCDLPPMGGESDLHRAERCAEWFVARNGYTDAPAVDASLLASESIEFEARNAWAGERHGSLVPGAVVVCRFGKRAAGYTVGFAHAGDTTRRLGRGVTMDTAFDELRVEHVKFALERAMADTAECEPAHG